MTARRKGRPVNGWLVLDKPTTIGSTPALGRTRRVFDAQKAGHAGTLDPLASGVLPVAFGEATKTISYLTDAEKVYECVIRLGVSTSTDDAEGEIIATSSHRPTPADIARAIPHFIGEISQLPPQFSAIKLAGQRAYDIARRGAVADIQPRIVHIEHIEILENADPDCVSLRVTCGKGTYIRALARDLALYVGTLGHIEHLRRTRVGIFSLNHAIGLEKLSDLSHSARDLADLDTLLLPLETVLDDIPALALDADQVSLIKHGQPVPTTMADQDNVWASFGRKAVALGHVAAHLFKPRRVINQPL